ncbi:unnamed protein product [Victoria cruziana]
MFFSRTTDSMLETCGVVAMSPVSMRFVWPYGGRRVSLCGSFTRWSEQIPMSPMEGCPTVFQVVCRVIPGYHQYIFIVDGERRHDEHQPYVSGDYGIVNTVMIAREPDPGSALLTPVSRMNMDVDNETFDRVVTLSDGTLQEPVTKISEADINVSCRRISEFLSTHTAYELLPESGKVVALDVNLPVKQAFHILYEQGIPVAPLWDFYRGQFVGVLSPLDFILILRELRNNGSILTEDELETHTISAWKEEKLHLHRKTVRRPLVHASPCDSLKDVALKILQSKVATVPIIHTSSPDGCFPHLLHLASLSGILKCICRHFRHSSSSLPILQQPIFTMNLGTWASAVGGSSGCHLATLKSNASLGSALALLLQAEVSSIPIVDDNNSLVDIYSRSDITALAKDKAYAQIHLDETSVHQALQLGQDMNSPYGFFNGQRCQMCLRTDTLQKVMERLANPGVRRVIIVEAGSKRIEGIVSLSDVFNFLLG